MRTVAELKQRYGDGHDESQDKYVKYTSNVVQRQLGVAERLLRGIKIIICKNEAIFYSFLFFMGKI